MANLEHIKIIRKGVGEWNSWKEKNTAIQPNFTDADLSGANLSGADLSGANLVRVNLSGANLCHANLSDANLFHANLSKANLSGAKLPDSDFSGANLRGANLKHANLWGANLWGADLTAANLRHANLWSANLSGADLSGANLVRVNLSGANLCHANLRDADLSGAILSAANLSKVNFSHAVLGKTIFAFTSLKSSFGLRSVKVVAPCSIDFETLKNSEKIRRTFLSKIGLPESYMEHFSLFRESDEVLSKPYSTKVVISIPQPRDDVLIAEKITDACGDFMEALGFELEMENEPIMGSYFKEISSFLKKKATNDEIGEIYKKGINALETKYINLPTAKAGGKLANSASNLIAFIKDIDEAALRFGAILVVKIEKDGKIIILSETVSTQIAHILDNNSNLLKYPQAIYELIKGDQDVQLALNSGDETQFIS